MALARAFKSTTIYDSARHAASLPRKSDLVTIIASAQGEGAFIRMLTGRDERHFVLDHDPHLKPGDWLVEEDRLLGIVVWVGDNEDRDDWITGHATKWTVKFERPWNHTDMKTTIGNAKVEWLEDEIFPRAGRVISVDESSHFRPGDLIRLG